MRRTPITHGFFIIGLFVVLVAGACGSQTEKSGDTAIDNVDQRATADEGFIEIFDGKSLDNWEGDASLWRVENGSLVGEIVPGSELKTNSFIVWRGGTTEDFELKTEVRITESGNSGINYRSAPFGDIPNALTGYQADIDGKNTYTGQNYEERGRTTLAYQGEKSIISSQPDPGAEGSLRANVKKNAWQSREVTERIATQDSLRTLMNVNDWNEIHIVAKGNLLQHYVNGVLICEVTDNDEHNRKMSGVLGVQVHVGPPMKVEYRNIRLKTINQ